MNVTNVKMGLLGCVFAFFLFSCEREMVQPAQPTPENEKVENDSTSSDKDTESKESITEKNSDRIAKTIGDGSGQIIIENTKNVDYTIAPGTYWNITVINTENVSISGLNKVKINQGDMKLSNVNNVTIANLSIENWSQNAVIISESANNLKLDNISFKNITNTVITMKNEVKYNGSKESYSENIVLNNIKAENIGTLFGSNGGLKNDGYYGLIKGFKLTNSSIKNSPILSNAIYLSLGEDYEISNNTVDNVNSQNNNHNGIFHVIGNGKIFGNKVTNHQGNAVRAWLASITKAGVVEIYNNIVYNSTRYGAFELQVTPWMYELASFKPANAKVYNNTAGKLNTGTPKYFEGRLLDLYNTYGTLEIFNNLSFDNRDNLLINNMSDTKIIKNTNNRYFKNNKDAVIDLTTFKSLIPGIGAK